MVKKPRRQRRGKENPGNGVDVVAAKKTENKFFSLGSRHELLKNSEEYFEGEASGVVPDAMNIMVIEKVVNTKSIIN